ncbi:MAG: sensor histidine kinase [Myxococcota bacterium]
MSSPETRDNLAYAVTFGLLAMLGAWWTVLITRLVEENHRLEIEVWGATSDVLEEYARQKMMLMGESVTLTALMMVLVALVVVRTRRERQNMKRLEGVLAASTHELKTPIAGVKALLESLESGVLPPELAKPYIRKGLESTTRLEHLVEGILAYQAAVVRGRKMEVRALAEWVEPILEHRGSTVAGERVEVELDGVAQTMTRGDGDAVRVVLENLLDNARKYGGGSVRMRARADATHVHLEVVDGGEGFGPEDAEQLFEPYRRGDGGGVKHGTGLGLYIARTLARGMGGDLRAESAGQGKGATFTLSLPRA